MSTFLIIIVGFLFIISVAYCVVCINESDINMFHKIMSFIISVLVCILFIYIINAPTPLDVYRGKTELKCKGIYKDSIFIPTDSTVIFKTNY